MAQTIKEHIESLLTTQLAPIFLEVTDESWQHGGGPDAQSHFKIIVVSETFQGQKLLARHRLIQGQLADIIRQIRALSLHTMSPEEWQQSQEKTTDFRSPGCHNKK